MKNTEFGRFHPSYAEAVPRYLTALDQAFIKAKEKCEFEFLLTLFRVRGVDYSGIGDAYQTTLRSIPLLLEIYNQTESFEAARNLQLWIYGHIVEASEPYEIICNLVKVSLGERFGSQFYPYKVGKSRPESPGSKIDHIKKNATKAGIPEVVIPLEEIWDRHLRNAIFHSDYILHFGDVYIRGRKYTHEEIMTIVTRSVVYHEALSCLYKFHIQNYVEPVRILTHPGFSSDGAEKAMVIVREGHGAVGLKDAWSKEELSQGRINWCIGRFTKAESDLLRNNPTLALLPQSPKNTETH
jgi:hypothetical protein